MDDGPIRTLYDGVELFSREIFLPPVLIGLQRQGVIETVSRDELLEEYPVTFFGTYHSDVNESRGEVEPFISIIPEGLVLSNTGFVVTADGRLVSDSVGSPSSESERIASTLVHQLFRSGTQITVAAARGDTEYLTSKSQSLETVFPLIPRYPNYYHWTIECLPTLHFLEQFTERTGHNPSILIPAEAPSWMTDSLHHIVSDQFDVIRATSRVYSATNVVLPSYSSLNRQSCEWVRTRATERSSASSDDFSKRVYISRENARERRVRNEGEVIDMLAEYGFKSYRLEELRVAEQIALFSNAEIVVGPHGAGFANLIYSDDISVIEIFGMKKKGTYKRIAETLGFEYRSLQFDTVGTDILVDLSQLNEALDSLERI